MSVIDLSTLPLPTVIAELAVERIIDEIKADLVSIHPPIAPVLQLESAVVVKLLQAFAYRENLLRARVNDAARAVLAPLSSGTDLDAIAARVNVRRLVVTPANPVTNTPAIMESDAALLRRYLLAFDRPSAGSRDRYLLEAFTALPTLGSVAVLGHAVHGRRGDIDIVASGPDGRDLTDDEIATLRSAVMRKDVAPEAVAVTVMRARRVLYAARLVLEVSAGPSPEIVRLAAVERVKRATRARTVIGGEVPPGLVVGAAYGENVIRVRDLDPTVIAPDPYSAPVCSVIEITAEVQS